MAKKLKSIDELREKFPNLIDRKEAEKRGIKIRADWRNAKKGDYICTIDNIVLEVLKTSEKKHYNHQKPTKHVHTEIGRFPVTIGRVYAKRIPLNDDGNLLGSYHLMNIFVQEMIEHGELGKNGNFTSQSKIDNYMTVYQDNNEVNALIRANNILKKRNVRKYMSKNMKEAFETLEWKVDKVAKEYIALYKKSKVPAAVKKQILDKISEFIAVEDGGKGDVGYMLNHANQKQLKGISQFFSLVESYKAQNKIIDGVFVDINEFSAEAAKLLNPKKEK